MINWGGLTEDQLFQLFRREYPDIIDLNEENEYSPVDWYIPSLNIHIEAKCRNRDFPTFYIEEIKYNKLIEYERCWYVNSDPTGIYAFDIHKFKNLVFVDKLVTKTQQFGRKELVWKSIGEIPKQRVTYLFNNKLLY